LKTTKPRKKRRGSQEERRRRCGRTKEKEKAISCKSGKKEEALQTKRLNFFNYYFIIK